MRIHFSENTYFAFLLLVFLSIGFFGAQYYSEHEARFAKHRYSTEEIRRTHTLSQRLNRAEYHNAHLEFELAELSLKSSRLTEERNARTLQQLARFAGLAPQSGEGVEVILKDSTRPLLLGDNPNTGIVHNTDLVAVVNELRAAGATAVAVNNQPVTTLTAITCSGPIILINNTRITSPFTIRALGNPDALARALNRPDSLVRELKGYGIEVGVIRKAVEIPGASPEMVQL